MAASHINPYGANEVTTVNEPAVQGLDPFRGYWPISRGTMIQEWSDNRYGSELGRSDSEIAGLTLPSNVDRAYWITGFDYHVMQRSRSDVAALTRFLQHVDFASAHLLLALDTARVDERVFARRRRSVSRTQAHHGAVSHFVRSAFVRWDELRDLLAVKWVPSVEAEPFAFVAFLKLSELTPAYTHLREMAALDWNRATRELSGQLENVAGQLWEAVRLASDVSDLSRMADRQANEALVAELETSLLDQAGGGVPLKIAQGRLQFTRQNLHKRIASGSILAVRHSGQLVLPAIQFMPDGDRERVVAGLADVLRPFEAEGAGSWAALRFLLDVDPNLGQAPIELLRSGETEAVAAATRARLELGPERD